MAQLGDTQERQLEATLFHFSGARPGQSQTPWMLQGRRLGRINQAHHPTFTITPELRSSPGPCSSSNPFPRPMLLQPSGEKAPPWLLSAPTKGRHWGGRGGKMRGVGFVLVTRRVRLTIRGSSSPLHLPLVPGRPVADKTSNPCQTPAPTSQEAPFPPRITIR